MSQTETTEIRRKRLKFRAWHRGMKEMDFIFGTFADKNLQILSDEELDLFEILLEQQDQDVLSWITGKNPLPAQFDTPIFHRVKDYKPQI